MSNAKRRHRRRVRARRYAERGGLWDTIRWLAWRSGQNVAPPRFTPFAPDTLEAIWRNAIKELRANGHDVDELIAKAARHFGG